jgi:arylsulfatase A-like enzyme
MPPARRRVATLLVLVLALGCGGSGGGPRDLTAQIADLRARRDWNLVFLLVDTLRANRLGSYGYAAARTPHLDALAAHGVRFARVIAQSSWTKTSMASLLTATRPVRNGVLRWDQGLGDDEVLPAERLREQGFRTAAIYRNLWVDPTFGFAQGFDSYVLARRPGAPLGGAAAPARRIRHGTDALLTASAREFLRSFQHERFYLYLHYMDVHDYALDEPGFTPRHSALYDDGVARVDAEIGALLAALEELGLRSRTLVVLASDHGEGLREHRHEGHGKTLYVEEIEVPLILSLPGPLGPGLVVDAPVENVDLWPTLYDLLGLTPQPGADGRSLVPWIEQAARGTGEPPAARPAFSHLDRSWGQPSRPPTPIVAVTDGRHRLIQDALRDDAYELYAHDTDPGERHSLRGKATEEARRLQALVSEYLRAAPEGEAARVDVDEETRESLRALGYAIP